jgi:catechol 2,3-dioxygenase-like lactoylglutathione lyase family enzyme
VRGLRHLLRDFTATAVREHLRDQAQTPGRTPELTKSEIDLVRFVVEGPVDWEAVLGEETGGVGAVSELRVVLTVPDFDAGVSFYGDALGLEQIADWSSDQGRVVALRAGRATLELFDEDQATLVDEIEAGERVSGTVRLALRVADSTATAARLVTAGAGAVGTAATTPWGDRNARVRAPDGMQLTLFTGPPE